MAMKVYETWYSLILNACVRSIACFKNMTQPRCKETSYQERLGVTSATTPGHQEVGMAKKRRSNGNAWFLLCGAIVLLLLASTATAGVLQVGNEEKTKFDRTSTSFKNGSRSRMTKVASDISSTSGILFVLMGVLLLTVVLIVVVGVCMSFGINLVYTCVPRRRGRFYFWIGSRYTQTDSKSKARV